MTSSTKYFLVLLAGLVIGAIIVGVPLGLWIFFQSNTQPQIPAATQIIPPTETPLSFLTKEPTATLPPTATQLPSSTPLPTNTAIPSFTPEPLAMATSIILTTTNSGSTGSTGSSSPTITATPVDLCNRAEFVDEKSDPTGIFFAPGDGLVKTWWIKNVGTCAWSTDYDLVFDSGTAMTKKNLEVAFPDRVNPGEKVKLSVKLSVPEQPGEYTGAWMLRSNKGVLFGIGKKFDQPLTVAAKVLNINTAANFDFITHVCEAKWRNSHNMELDCPGSATGNLGFVMVLENPKMEHRSENEPALSTHPDHRAEGWITGIYPAYTVQEGDHFRSTVGCLEDSKGCKVVFELAYRTENNPPQILGSWEESFNGEATNINLDLSALTGQKVQFILTVRVNNQKANMANAFWFVPRIEK